MIGKFLLLLALLAIVIAMFVSPELYDSVLRIVRLYLPLGNSSKSIKTPVLTKAELAQYTGKDGSRIYLAILGEVFDVTKGSKHYGEGGGYHFFTGRDATRAFVSGDFKEKGLIEDTSGLSHTDLLGIEEWNKFYKEQYTFVGKLNGHFYDEKGQPTAALKDFLHRLKEAKAAKMSDEDDKKTFPPCNFEYKQGWGRRIWCSTLSGGVQRDWAGVPRQYFQPGKSEPRCACIRDKGPPAGSKPGEKHSNRGDLDNPLMKLYEGCDKMSFECFFKE